MTTTPHLITEGPWESISCITAGVLLHIHMCLHTLSAQEYICKGVLLSGTVHHVLPTCLAPNPTLKHVPHHQIRIELFLTHEIHTQ